MKYKFITALLLAGIIAGGVVSQDRDEIKSDQTPEQFGIEHLTEYLGLKPDDIGFRPDYTEPDSFRLKIIADLMQKPLGMIEYVNDLKNSHVKKQPEIMAGILFQDLVGQYQDRRHGPYQPDISEVQRTYNLYYTDMVFNQFLTKVATYLDVVLPKSAQKSLALLNSTEREFLKRQFKELITESEELEFLSVEEIDSVEKVEEGYTEPVSYTHLRAHET